MNALHPTYWVDARAGTATSTSIPMRTPPFPFVDPRRPTPADICLIVTGPPRLQSAISAPAARPAPVWQVLLGVVCGAAILMQIVFAVRACAAESAASPSDLRLGFEHSAPCEVLHLHSHASGTRSAASPVPLGSSSLVDCSATSRPASLQVGRSDDSLLGDGRQAEATTTGIDCSRHCSIAGATYCARQTTGSWLACDVCLPDHSTTTWTLLAVGAPCPVPYVEPKQ